MDHEQVRSFQMPAQFWLRRAERSQEEGRPVQALTLFRHALKQEPEQREWRLQYAYRLYRLSCYEASNRQCFSILARWPSMLGAFGLIALNMLALGRMNECADAYAFYAQYARIAPERLPEWDEEVYEVEDALFSQRPDQPPRFRRLDSLLRHAGRRLLKGDLEGAGELLYRSRQTPFRAPSPERDALWAALLFQNEGRVHAPQAIRAALESNRRSSSTLCSLATMLYSLKQPSWQPAFLLATLYARLPEEFLGVCLASEIMGAEALVIAQLQRVLKYEPTRLDAAFDLCVLRLRRGEQEEAERTAHLLRELDPLNEQVETLFQRVRLLREGELSPDEQKKLTEAQGFYGAADRAAEVRLSMRVLSRLEQGPAVAADLLRQDEKAREDFLSALHLFPALYAQVPLLCREMDDDDARTFLRRLLLNEPADDEIVRLLCGLLERYGVEKPYLTRRRRRLELFDPEATVETQPALWRRLCFRRLREIARVSGGEALPEALAVFARLPRRKLLGLIGDRYHVFAAAFATVYAQRRGFPAPVLDGTFLLFPRRWKALMGARRAIRAAFGGVQPRKGSEPDDGTD